MSVCVSNLPTVTVTVAQPRVQPITSSLSVIKKNFSSEVSKTGMCIGIARGAHAPPRAEKNSLGPNLQGKVVSAPPGRECTPEAQQESNF